MPTGLLQPTAQLARWTGAPPTILKMSPGSSTIVVPSAGAGRMWSTITMLPAVIGTGLPQPSVQLARWIGAPPANLKMFPASSFAVAPSAGWPRM